MDFKKIDAITQTRASFSVYAPGTLDWGTAYNGGTDSQGRIYCRTPKVFSVHKLSISELNASDSEIAQICIRCFQSFSNPEYTAKAISIHKSDCGETSVSVLAYSNTVTFIGRR